MNRYWKVLCILLSLAAVSCVETVPTKVASDEYNLVTAEDVQLIKAVRSGNVEKVSQLISSGANVNAHGTKSEWGKTPLIEASIMEKFYEEAGIYDEWATVKWRPIYLEIARTLIKAGADVNGKDSYGNTALMYCALYGNTELANVLLKSGADVNAKSSKDTTALMAAAESGRLAIVRMLIKDNADVNSGYGSVTTALSRANRAGHKEIVQELVNAGARY